MQQTYSGPIRFEYAVPSSAQPGSPFNIRVRSNDRRHCRADIHLFRIEEDESSYSDDDSISPIGQGWDRERDSFIAQFVLSQPGLYSVHTSAEIQDNGGVIVESLSGSFRIRVE